MAGYNPIWNRNPHGKKKVGQKQSKQPREHYTSTNTHSGPNYNFWRRFFAGNWNAPGYRSRGGGGGCS